MAVPNTRQTLIDYCLRALGAPVLEINVDDDQVSDRIDEAFQFFREYHHDAIIKIYKKHQLSAQDISNQYITLPESMLYVTRLFPLTNNSSNSSGMFSARYQVHLNDLYDLQYAGALANYVETRQYLESLDLLLNGTPAVRFNRHMSRLKIDIDWSTVVQNDWLVVEGYETVDEAAFAKVYNDKFLKRYATALIKRQWGQNMSKFEGMVLPGGVTLNGTKMMDDANAEILALETDIVYNSSLPVDFMIG
jgi:hypothetical protein